MSRRMNVMKKEEKKNQTPFLSFERESWFGATLLTQGLGAFLSLIEKSSQQVKSLNRRKYTFWSSTPEINHSEMLHLDFERAIHTRRDIPPHE